MAGPTYSNAMGQGVLTFQVDPITLKAYLRAIGSLDKEVQDEIRDASQLMSRRLADDLVRAAYTSPTPQAKLVAQSITTPRDRLPTVKIGGKKRVGREYRSREQRTGKTGKALPGKKIRAMAGELLYGSEYGSYSGKDRSGRDMGRRFVAPRNSNGYWIEPTTAEWGTYLFREWVTMVDNILEREGIRG